MGRSPGGRGGIGEGARVWEQARRALARLLTQAVVHDLPPRHLDSPVTIQSTSALDAPAIRPGCRESALSPAVRVLSGGIPEVRIGGGGADGIAMACRLSADSALRSVPNLIRGVPLPDAYFQERALPLGRPRMTARVAPAGLIPLIGGPARRIPLVAAVREAVALDNFHLRPSTVCIPQRWGCDRRGVPQPPDCPVHSHPAVLTRVPLVRSRRAAPPGLMPAEVFAAETGRLAAAVGAPLEDIALVGVFPGVPIAALSRLSLEAEGKELHVWLKPEVIGAAARPRLMTLVIGRRRSTGKLVQTVV